VYSIDRSINAAHAAIDKQQVGMWRTQVRNAHQRAAAAALGLLGLLHSPLVQSSGYTGTGWEEGARGYESALAEAKREALPMIVYFNTEWCPWCRQLNERYLPDSRVSSVLRDFVKVSVNPEDGDRERRLFEQHGGGGYPGFFVAYPAGDAQAVKLSPFRKGGPWSPEKFAEEINERVATLYERNGVALARTSDCAGAIDYFEAALDWTELRQASLYYNIGRCYHLQASQRRDRDLLSRAKSYYEKALAHDPSHEASRRALDGLADKR